MNQKNCTYLKTVISKKHSLGFHLSPRILESSNPWILESLNPKTNKQLIILIISFILCLQLIVRPSSAAITQKIAGIFIEVHDNPEKAPCDGPNYIRLSRLEKLLKYLIELDAWVKSNEFPAVTEKKQIKTKQSDLDQPPMKTTCSL